jgi:CcmD family protein
MLFVMVMVMVMEITVCGWLVASPAFAQQGQAGQVRETIPAAPFLAGAYVVIWLAVLGYVALTAKRLARVERDLNNLRQRIGQESQRSESPADFGASDRTVIVMDLPPSSHFIYIPALLMLGVVLGFVWGVRVTREAFQLEEKRAQERARRKEAREQKKNSPPSVTSS